jgi:hypothetical protein
MKKGFNSKDWQGRTKRQVESNYRMAGIAIGIGIAVLTIVSIFDLFKSMFSGIF